MSATQQPYDKYSVDDLIEMINLKDNTVRIYEQEMKSLQLKVSQMSKENGNSSIVLDKFIALVLGQDALYAIKGEENLYNYELMQVKYTESVSINIKKSKDQDEKLI